MSHIFSTETKTTTRPRHDATIRIQYLGPDDTKWGGQWRTVELPGKVEGDLLVTNSCPPTPLHIAVARVGEVAFVGLGCEGFNEIGQAIKAGSPFAQTIIITHCNGAAGYLPTRAAYLEGGYEVRSSRFAPAAAEQVIKEAVHMLHTL